MTIAAGPRIGPYEVVALLGAGGMGEVYRARDTRLGREVALKRLPARFAHSPSRLERLKREARILASLNHPHIATLYGLEETDGTPILAMELVEGATLAAVLRRGPLPVAEALEYARQIAEALEAAHERNVLHRDLKPANVRLTGKGQVKLLDFGLAKAFQDDQSPSEPGRHASTLTSGEASASPTSGISGTAPYMSPEQTRGEGLDPRTDVWAFGCVLFEMLSGKRAFPGATTAEASAAVLEKAPPWAKLPDNVPTPVRRLLERCLQKERDKRLRDIGDARLEIDELLQGRRGGRPGPDAEPSPYPGLRSFTEEDAPRFFGREAEVSAIWTKLSTRKLLAVIGPSGAGKTSFVRAGIVTSCPSGWGAAVCTPGTRPFASLAQALAPELAGNAEAVADLVQIEDPEHALAAISHWRHAHVEALLVVDQFEELFTLNPPETQRRFAELLGRIAEEGDIHVLLSMRDDFLIRCHEQAALAAVFCELTPLLALEGEALRRALVEPGAREGYVFEDETLVQELLGFAAEERGALPLLAFALARLWERRDREGKLLTRRAYEEIGGVAGALARHAEATLESLDPEREPIVREILRNLVTSEGTRAVMEREELLSVFGADHEQASRVLDALVDARLLTEHEARAVAPSGAGPASAESRTPSAPAGHRHLEIVHESLLQAWPRLVRWQTQDADGAQLRDQLRQAARLWDEKGRSPDLLWTGTVEREFELWRERYAGALTAVEDGFARAVVGRARRRRQLRRVVAAGIVATAVLVATVTTSLWLRGESARERAATAALRSQASELLSLAQLRLETDPTEALALTTASLELADSREARLFALKVLWEAPPALELAARIGMGMRAVSFSPDGRWLVASGHAKEASVWSETGARVALLPGHVVTPRACNVAHWGPAGMLVSGLQEAAESLHVWAIPSGQKLRTIELGGESGWQVDQERLLTWTRERPDRPGTLPVLMRSWTLPDGQPAHLGRLDLAQLKTSGGLFMPGGDTWIYTTGREVRLRSLQTDASDRLLTRHPAQIDLLGPTLGVDLALSRDTSGGLRSFTFPTSGPPEVEIIPRPTTAPGLVQPEASGRWLVTSASSEDRQARVWNRAAWPVARPVVLRRSASWYAALRAFHTSGDWIVASTENFMNLTFWPLRRTPPAVADGYTVWVRPLEFSPDGRWLVTSWGDQRLRRWGVGEGKHEAPALLDPPVRARWTEMALDASSRFAFVVGDAGRAAVVPLDGSPSRPLGGYGPDVLLYSAAVSPTGRRVASAFALGRGERTLSVWDLKGGAVRRFELGERRAADVPGTATEAASLLGGIVSLAFDGESALYSASLAGIHRWNIDDGKRTRVFAARPGHTVWAEFAVSAKTALVRQLPVGGEVACLPFELVDLRDGTSRELSNWGSCPIETAMQLDRSGTIAVTGDRDGLIRVGRLASGAPHVLAGHEGAVQFVAVSPDLKWVASSGEDNTLRLWPMPDLDKPPLHTLPHDELIAKLKSLTNFRAVRDPAAPNGWKIEIGPFPGWKNVPTW